MPEVYDYYNYVLVLRVRRIPIHIESTDSMIGPVFKTKSCNAYIFLLENGLHVDRLHTAVFSLTAQCMHKVCTIDCNGM